MIVCLLMSENFIILIYENWVMVYKFVNFFDIVILDVGLEYFYGFCNVWLKLLEISLYFFGDVFNFVFCFVLWDIICFCNIR